MNIWQMLDIFILSFVSIYFCFIMLDFVDGIIELWHKVASKLQSSIVNITDIQADSKSNYSESLQVTQNVTFTEQPNSPLDILLIDIHKINFRAARKIAAAIKKTSSDLAIKQKLNGKDAPLAWLQVQIKNRLELAPEIVKPIIEEFAPNTFSGFTRYIQHNCLKNKRRAS